MTRDLLFDQILKHLYENPSRYWVIDALAKQHFGVTDKQLLESIIDELLERRWGTPMKDSKWSIKITFDGQQIIDKHGSYSSFLKSLQKVESKANRNTSINRILGILGGCGILWTAIFTFLSYDKGELIKQKEEKIIQLQSETDSLRILSENQELTIDSLKTVLTRRDTVNKSNLK